MTNCTEGRKAQGSVNHPTLSLESTVVTRVFLEAMAGGVRPGQTSFFEKRDG